MSGGAKVGTVRASVPTVWVRDVAGAVVLTVFFLLASGHNRPPTGGHAIDAVGYVLLVLAGVSVALCRRFPRAAVVVVIVVLGCYLGRGYPEGPIYLAGMVTLFSLGWHTSRRVAFTGAAATVVVLSVVATTMRGAGLTVLPVIFVGWAAAAVLLGVALRTRRGYLDGVRERTRSQELTREEQARRRIAEDRLRIARDLHDSVGHAMAMINVQAAAGAHVADQRPDAAKQALLAIQNASGQVIEELTAMLSVLRAEGELAQRSPTPGIAQIRQLVQGSASARLHTTIVFEGPTDEVPEAVGVAAYRIVQESLTNVIRHAHARQARVTVKADADRGLQIEVCDDGTGIPPASAAPDPAPHSAANSRSPGNGIGIRGMRERAESSGGRLEAGPRPKGGYAVHASWGPRP